MVQAKNIGALAAFIRDRRIDYVQPGETLHLVGITSHQF
jgi:hypothetical protein